MKKLDIWLGIGLLLACVTILILGLNSHNGRIEHLETQVLVLQKTQIHVIDAVVEILKEETNRVRSNHPDPNLPLYSKYRTNVRVRHILEKRKL